MNQMAWLVGAAVLLSGCGNCNILSGGNLPARCEAGLATGTVLLAPAVIPMAIADDAKARSAPVRPVEDWQPKTAKAKAIYKAATASD
jgi:hypothetical protein